jgi:phenylacetate-CoA ligase
MKLFDLVKDLTLTLMGLSSYELFFKNSCSFNKKKIEEYQFKKIRNLLIESNKNVPYYREVFKSINFKPQEDFQNLADLNQIPILTKEKAIEVRPYLDNVRYKNNVLKLRTSGSTGEPFEVSVSYKAWIVEQAVVWRHWKWSGYNFRDKMAMVRSYAPKNGEKFVKYDIFRNLYKFSPFNLSDNQISDYLKLMIEKKISILRGYPSSILNMAEYVFKTNHPIPKLKLILTASETLTDLDRKFIEEVFKSKISNHYGLAEIVLMMGDCNSHCGMHNYDDYGYLELLDTNIINQKKIIGTNLHNLATPLIRYDTNDLAEIKKNDCDCGHNFVTIHNVIGRYDQQIKTPEGFKIPTVNFYTCLEHFQQIRRWQIVQRSLDCLEVIIKLKSNESVFEADIKAEFEKRLPPSMNVLISQQARFIQKNEGKINPFVSLL